MAIGNFQVGNAQPITATLNIKRSQGALLGFIVSASTSGTVAIYDSADATTTVPLVSATTLTAGTWIDMPIAFSAGCYIVVGGTLSATAVYI